MNPSRSQIIALQQAIIAANCSVGSTGADGIFGPRTRSGLNCMIEALGGDEVRSQFSFVDFLLGYGGTYRPPATAGGGGGSGQQPPATNLLQAGVGGEIPWWGWALIAAGGAGLLAFVGLMMSGGEDDRSRDRRGRYGRDRYGRDFDDWDMYD